MEYKPPIFDRTEQAALLGACSGHNEYIPVWLMLRLGVPAKALQEHDITVRGDCIYWLRANSAIPRRAVVPKEILPKVKWWIKMGRKRSMGRISQVVAKVGGRVKHPEYTSDTLLNSNAVNQIRDALDEGLSLETTVNMDAERTGRKTETIKDLYLAFEKWRQAGGATKEIERLRGNGEKGAC